MSVLTPPTEWVWCMVRRECLRGINMINDKVMNALREEFNSIEKLYHYTSFESCKKIIETNTLLFGRLKQMNDINEFYRPLFYNNNYTCKNAKKSHEIINQLQQISLTRDNDKRGKLGFEIPSMWGHYAKKGKGVCIVFDKRKLIECASHSGLNIIHNDKINYINNFRHEIIMDSDKQGNVIDFSKKSIKRFFFIKTKDWEPEQEYRILAKNDTNRERLKLSLQNSLVAVIMHNASVSDKMKSIFFSKRFYE